MNEVLAKMYNFVKTLYRRIAGSFSDVWYLVDRRNTYIFTSNEISASAVSFYTAADGFVA